MHTSKDQPIAFGKFGYEIDSEYAAVLLQFGHDDKTVMIEIPRDNFLPFVGHLVKIGSLISAHPPKTQPTPKVAPDFSSLQPILTYVTDVEISIHPTTGILKLEFLDDDDRLHHVVLSQSVTALLRARLKC